MDIKEIAKKFLLEKEAWGNMPYDKQVELLVQFVAEIQRQNQQVGLATLGKSMLSMSFIEATMNNAEPIKLFTFPPSIESERKKVAEACAALCCSYFYHADETAEDCFDTPQEAATAIRSGEWKKFMKGE